MVTYRLFMFKLSMVVHPRSHYDQGFELSRLLLNTSDSVLNSRNHNRLAYYHVEQTQNVLEQASVKATLADRHYRKRASIRSLVLWLPKKIRNLNVSKHLVNIFLDSDPFLLICLIFQKIIYTNNHVRSVSWERKHKLRLMGKWKVQLE